MIHLGAILALVWIHTIADFVAQSDKMAQNKSKSNKWLAIHVGVYSAFFLIFGWLFALVNFVLHFITDYFTSRLSSRLWQAGERHWFFVVIGVDQAIHITSLVVTYYYLAG